MSVTNIAPARPIANNTTSAPAQLSVERSGSPMIAPNQPPACDIASTSATILSAPLTTCNKPKTASTTTVQPIAKRTRCSTLRRRTMATPIPTTTTGSANRPRPSNQPNMVSMPLPNGPAMLRYMDNTRTTPVLMSPMPQNSTSRPRTMSRAESAADSPDFAVDFPAGRLLPFGGVFTPPREPPDPFEPPDDEREPLPDMNKKVLLG